MSYRTQNLASWDSDAQRALTESPGYFMRWYTLKSLGLVVAIAIAAYYVGKSSWEKQR